MRHLSREALKERFENPMNPFEALAVLEEMDRRVREGTLKPKGGDKHMADDIFIKVGAMWKNRDSKDQLMYRGSVTVKDLLDWLDAVGVDQRADDARLPIVLLVNNYKKEQTHPDFNLFGSDPDRKQESRGGRGGYSRRQDRDEPEPAPRTRAPRDPEPATQEDRPKRRYTRKASAPPKGRSTRSTSRRAAKAPARGRGRLRLSR